MPPKCWDYSCVPQLRDGLHCLQAQWLQSIPASSPPLSLDTGKEGVRVWRPVLRLSQSVSTLVSSEVIADLSWLSVSPSLLCCHLLLTRDLQGQSHCLFFGGGRFTNPPLSSQNSTSFSTLCPIPPILANLFAFLWEWLHSPKSTVCCPFLKCTVIFTNQN